MTTTKTASKILITLLYVVLFAASVAAGLFGFKALMPPTPEPVPVPATVTAAEPDPTQEPEATATPEPEATTTPEPEATAEPRTDGLPDVDIGSWNLRLVNAKNSVGEDFVPELVDFESVQLDARVADAMRAFAEAARAEGLTFAPISGYRSYELQTSLFNRKVEAVGEETAKTIVAIPGTSEHQTGLACDIAYTYNTALTYDLENTALYKWMIEHCDEYGFILRYPNGKSDETGIIYEPWHFRYVGVEAASYIMENDLTLEEFLELYK